MIESASNAVVPGLISRVGKKITLSKEANNGNPLQYSAWEIPWDRGILAMVAWIAKSWA